MSAAALQGLPARREHPPLSLLKRAADTKPDIGYRFFHLARIECVSARASEALGGTSTMSEITTLLRAAGAGDRHAADQAFALLYADLQRLAHSRMRRSGEMTFLDTTALVHESYLRLQSADGLDFADRQHFLGYAARVMRTVVVDLVRARLAERRGGRVEHVTLNTAIGDAATRHDDEVLRVHEALQELGAADERLAGVVEMRYFGGLSEAEIAAVMGVNERTVQRDWQKARMFLAAVLA
jgi:RNA polymerase sigma factor (TIGR02999 family)